MKILVSSLAFYPDCSGIPLFSSDFAFYAARKGHQVSVVTGFPFYPSWRKKKEDRRVLFRTDYHENVKIYRGYLYVPKRPNGLRRILQEVSFLIFAFVNFFRAGKHDVIVVFTTPVLLGVMGLFFKKVFGCKLLINVQDFQIEAAESLGMLNKMPTVLKFMRKLERLSYQHADLVSSISDGMVELLRQKETPDSKIISWPNWIDLDMVSVAGKRGDFRRKFSISEEKIIVAYSGNVGEKQGLKILVDLAFEFRSRSDLIFLIIGDGGDLLNLKTYHGEKSTHNLIFLPFLDASDYNNFLTDAQVLFISQKRIPKDIYFPSKLLRLMASNKLILLAANEGSELYRVLKKNDLGVVADIEDLEELKGALNNILDGKTDVVGITNRARNYVMRFHRESVLSGVLDKMQRVQEK